MKKYIVEVCHMNRLFGLKPIIKAKEFDNKDKADKYAAKFENHPNKFVTARYEEGVRVIKL